MDDSDEDELNHSAVMIEGTPLRISLPKGLSLISSSKRLGCNREGADAQEVLQLTLDSSTESNIRCSNIGKRRQGRRVVALETGASVPRQSAFINSIPYFLTCSSDVEELTEELGGEECVQIRVVELEESHNDDGSFEDNAILNNSTLFGEMVITTINHPAGKSSGASTPSSCFLDSAKFYTKYCEGETENGGPEAAGDLLRI